MTRKAKTSKGRKQKAGLNKSILSVGFGELNKMLTYKIEEKGGLMIILDTKKIKPSQRCPECGHTHKEWADLSNRYHICDNCGFEIPRDKGSVMVMYNVANNKQLGQMKRQKSQLKEYMGSVKGICMRKNLLEGKLTITKSSSKDIVYLQLEDEMSGLSFLEIQIDKAEFAEALFGLACRPCDFSLSAKNAIGKKRVSEPYSFEVSGGWANQKEDAKRIANELSSNDPEWDYSSYFGSQGSFTTTKDGKTIAHTTRYKYVSIDE